MGAAPPSSHALWSKPALPPLVPVTLASRSDALGPVSRTPGPWLPQTRGWGFSSGTQEPPGVGQASPLSVLWVLGTMLSSGWGGSAPRRSPHRSPAPIPRGAVKGVPREPPPQVPASHQPLCHVAAPSLGAAGPRQPPGSRCRQVSCTRLSLLGRLPRGLSPRLLCRNPAHRALSCSAHFTEHLPRTQRSQSTGRVFLFFVFYKKGLSSLPFVQEGSEAQRG